MSAPLGCFEALSQAFSERVLDLQQVSLLRAEGASNQPQTAFSCICILAGASSYDPVQMVEYQPTVLGVACADSIKASQQTVMADLEVREELHDMLQ